MGWMEVIVESSAIVSNLKVVRSIVGNRKIYAVVKSNAYGHGMLECVSLLEREGLKSFAVATVEEAVKVKEKFPSVEVLVLGGFVKEEISAIFDYGIIPVISNYDQIAMLEDFLKLRVIREPLKVHVEFDTGMGRMGFLPDEVGKLKDTLESKPFVKVVGVMSHFSVADETEPDSVEYTRRQMERFKAISDFFPGVVRHIANSAGVLFHRDALFDAVRVGIALYGGIKYPGLTQAMHVRSRIVEIKEVPEGWCISYGRKYKTCSKKKIGIVSSGYSLGFWRKFSSNAEVLVKGKRVPVIGTVCMDLFVVDLDGVPDVVIGDSVYILGGGKGGISVFELAKRAGTIPYEVFCSLGGYYERSRVYVDKLTTFY